MVAARAEGGRDEGTQGDATERHEGDLAQAEKGDVKNSLHEKVLSWLLEDNVDWAEGKDLGEIEKRFGNKPEPIVILMNMTILRICQRVTKQRLLL